jgi:hypothetical protein
MSSWTGRRGGGDGGGTGPPLPLGAFRGGAAGGMLGVLGDSVGQTGCGLLGSSGRPGGGTGRAGSEA